MARPVPRYSDPHEIFSCRPPLELQRTNNFLYNSYDPSQVIRAGGRMWISKMIGTEKIFFHQTIINQTPRLCSSLPCRYFHLKWALPPTTCHQKFSYTAVICWPSCIRYPLDLFLYQCNVIPLCSYLKICYVHALAVPKRLFFVLYYG